jgi:hypothetical protein
MSAATGGLAGTFGAHPEVRSRRLRHLLVLAFGFALPLAIGLAVSAVYTKPSIPLGVGIVVGVVCIAVLVTNPRLDISVMVAALYLGLLEGPVKLGTGGHEIASAVRDVVIIAVAAGAFMRLVASKQEIKLPPLSAWALAWIVLVLIEAFNPHTHGIKKILGGYRQQLEWVPFFFFGYALMRSKLRFRQFFLILGVIALANGIVSTYQTRLTPQQLASWGPGYRELALGTQLPGEKSGIQARAFISEGQARVRPPGLGTDAGFSGGVGVVALPALLALLATHKRRRRWPIVVLILGALAGIITGEGRLQVVGAVISVLLFTAISFSAGKKVGRPLAAILGVLLLAIPLGSVFVNALGSGTFGRYASISPGSLGSSTKDTKIQSLEQIPNVVAKYPFGTGLGSVGAAVSFGGRQEEEGIGAHTVSAETSYNFILDEVGLPGLVLYVALTLRLLFIGLGGLRRISDIDLRLYLGAMISTLLGLTLMGFSGTTMSSPAFATYFWFTAGTFAYWFFDHRRRVALQGARVEPIAEPA